MPQQTDSIETRPFSELIMLYAEKLGELTDRLASIEKEHAAQNVPIDAALKAQQAAMMTLDAALKGITSLKSHVLENDLGAVSVRVEELAKQTDAALRALDTAQAETKATLQALATDTATRLESVNGQRMELDQKRTGDAQAFEQRLAGVRGEITALEKQMADRIEAARKEFAEPKGFNPRGKFDPQAGKYGKLDVVELNGSSYLSTEDDNDEQPGQKAKKWQTLARRGAAAGGGGSTPEPASLQTLTDGATITWDLINPVAEVTLGGNRTLAFRNLRSGGTYVLFIQQDATGSRTLTWPASVVWQGGAAPTLTTTAAKVDVVYLAARGAVVHGSIGQNYAAS